MKITLLQLILLARISVEKLCSNMTVMALTGLGSTTIHARMMIMRAAITKFNEVNNLMIGGPGRVIEVDEAHFGRRKNHKGRIIAG